MPHQAAHAIAPTAGQAVVHLGNVWLIAATLANSILADSRAAVGEPLLMMVDVKGDLHAIGPKHPDYEQTLLAPGWVCTADSKMDLVRLAGRIRDAVLANATAGGGT